MAELLTHLVRARSAAPRDAFDLAVVHPKTASLYAALSRKRRPNRERRPQAVGFTSRNATEYHWEDGSAAPRRPVAGGPIAARSRSTGTPRWCVIVIIGLVSIVFSRYEYQHHHRRPRSSRPSGRPCTPGYSIDVCGKVHRPLAASTNSSTVGMRPPATGVLNVSPEDRGTRPATTRTLGRSSPTTRVRRSRPSGSRCPSHGKYHNGASRAPNGTPDAGQKGIVRGRDLAQRRQHEGHAPDTTRPTFKIGARTLVTVGFVPRGRQAAPAIPVASSTPCSASTGRCPAGTTTTTTTQGRRPRRPPRPRSTTTTHGGHDDHHAGESRRPGRRRGDPAPPAHLQHAQADAPDRRAADDRTGPRAPRLPTASTRRCSRCSTCPDCVHRAPIPTTWPPGSG